MKEYRIVTWEEPDPESAFLSKMQTKRGYFHRWHYDYYDYDGKREKTLFALIEEMDGRIIQIIPTDVTFTKETGNPVSNQHSHIETI